MRSKEEIEQVLKEAENRIIELDQFRQDSNNLCLEVIESQFLVVKRFYQERIEILKMILGNESLPF